MAQRPIRRTRQSDRSDPARRLQELGQFRQFSQSTQASLAKSGYRKTVPTFQGSAVTGRSHESGLPFDCDRASDFDIALAGEDIYAKAESLGLAKGGRTGPHF